MLGGVVGGDVAGNFFRRIGYICADDVSAGIPRWINGQWAVGLDTAGLTRGVSYRGNSFISCYGAAMDLDGFAERVATGLRGTLRSSHGTGSIFRTAAPISGIITQRASPQAVFSPRAVPEARLSANETPNARLRSR